MKFRNEVYVNLANDLIHDIFYSNISNRSKIKSVRQYAEIIVRKILKIDEKDRVSLGDYKIIKRLKEKNSSLLISSIEKICAMGNSCTHTQETKNILEEDVNDCMYSLFELYASLFVLYFKEYKFGSNDKVVSCFSILPPIIRFLTLNELYRLDLNNLIIIDKLSLVLLKAFDKNEAIKWLDEKKEKLSKLLPYDNKTIEHIRDTRGDIIAQSIIDNAPENMYACCIERINEVEEKIKKNGILYHNFEQAKQLYLEKGVLYGEQEEISKFNSIMEFCYLGRKKDENPNLNNLNNYITTI